MVKHVVMWRLKPQAEGADKAENARRIKAALEALRGRVPGLLSLEVGINVEPSAAAYDLVLCTAHESPEALAAYQVHPEHAKVGELIGKVRSDRVVVDYLA